MENNTPKYVLIVTYDNGKTMILGRTHSRNLEHFSSFEEVKAWIDKYGKNESFIAKFTAQIFKSNTHVKTIKEWNTDENLAEAYVYEMVAREGCK